MRLHFQPTDDDLVEVGRICRIVEGMPLGIELAAPLVEVLTPQEIAAEIRRGIDVLETDLRDVPARHRSMRAVFDHSWSLLTEREREVLRGLSVFRGGFTRQAAHQVTGATLRDLMALTHIALPQRTPSGRYEVHELLRQYAAEMLEASVEVDAVRDAHSAHYCAALEQWTRDLRGPRRQEAFTEMDAYIENARVAWDWAAASTHIALLDKSVDSLGSF